MSFESESINENVFFVKGNVHCFGNPRRKRILFALDKFRKLDLRFEKNKERLIDGLVKAIIVYDDRFEVFLTFDDTPITIPTSEEIESMKNSSDIASVTSLKKKNRQTAVFIFLPRYNTLRRYRAKRRQCLTFSAEQAPRSHRTGER